MVLKFRQTPKAAIFVQILGAEKVDPPNFEK
jgi:hypothetical protein